MIEFISGEPWRGVKYGCTTRAGGISNDAWESLNLALHVGDRPEAVHENRLRLARALPGEPYWLEQVHGTHVIDVDKSAISGRDAHGQGIAAPEPCADAAITTQPNRVLAVMTADCVPVVIADIEGKALAVAHAGWRGLAAGVLETTFRALQSRVPRAAGWRAWVGPCIGQARFEVGDEVRRAFVEVDPFTAKYFAVGKERDKWYADLASLTCHRLEILGVQSIESAGLCTYERADLFYSYRRTPVTGRMATVAWLTPPPDPYDLP